MKRFKGILYEAVLRKTLHELVPARVKVGTGFLVDLSEGRHSAQADIILYSDSSIAPVYQCQDFVVIDHRTSYAAVEVKSTLTKKVIEEAASNMKNLSEALPFGARWFLTAAKANISLAKVKEHSEHCLKNCSGVLVLEGNDSKQSYYVEDSATERGSAGRYPRKSKEVLKYHLSLHLSAQ